MIETQAACTNVPERCPLTVAEALAVLNANVIGPADARALRRLLLEVLAALDEAE